jgi:hypothetical protein
MTEFRSFSRLILPTSFAESVQLSASDKRLFRAQLEPLLQDSQHGRLDALSLPRYAAAVGMVPVVEEWLNVPDTVDEFKSDSAIPFREFVAEATVRDTCKFSACCCALRT